MNEAELTNMYDPMTAMWTRLVQHALAGLQPEEYLSVDTFGFDHLHYLGIEPLEYVMSAVGPQSVIYDIGSGLGGPVRYLADRTPPTTQIIGIEIQNWMNRLCQRMNKACGVDDRITILDENVLTLQLPNEQLPPGNVVFSILCFLHIADKVTLFHQCNQLLMEGGHLIIEDFLKASDREFTDNEQNQLTEVVSCQELIEEEKYLTMLEDAGFEIIEAKNMTEKWSDFVAERAERFAKQADSHAELIGVDGVAARQLFVDTVAELFRGGTLQGYRIHVVKKTK